MKVKVTDGPVRVNSGTIIKPTKDQLARRMSSLKKGTRGWYEATKPLEFKTGEILELKVSGLGELPPPLAERCALPEDEAASDTATDQDDDDQDGEDGLDPDDEDQDGDLLGSA